MIVEKSYESLNMWHSCGQVYSVSIFLTHSVESSNLPCYHMFSLAEETFGNWCGVSSFTCQQLPFNIYIFIMKIVQNKHS